MVILDILLGGGAIYGGLTALYHIDRFHEALQNSTKSVPLDVKLRQDRVPQPPRFDVEAHELALWRDTGAWWLDPNRWDDKPADPDRNAVYVHHASTGPLTLHDNFCEKHKAVWFTDSPCPMCKPIAPNCPRCHTATMIPLTEYAGEVYLWSCSECRGDYKRDSKLGWMETRLSAKKRLSAERRRKLPCGCSHDTKLAMRSDGAWGRIAICTYCGSGWQASDSDARQIASGKTVEPEAWRIPPSMYPTRPKR